MLNKSPRTREDKIVTQNSKIDKVVSTVLKVIKTTIYSKVTSNNKVTQDKKVDRQTTTKTDKNFSVDM